MYYHLFKSDIVVSSGFLSNSLGLRRCLELHVVDNNFTMFLFDGIIGVSIFIVVTIISFGVNHVDVSSERNFHCRSIVSETAYYQSARNTGSVGVVVNSVCIAIVVRQIILVNISGISSIIAVELVQIILLFTVFGKNTNHYSGERTGCAFDFLESAEKNVRILAINVIIPVVARSFGRP